MNRINGVMLFRRDGKIFIKQKKSNSSFFFSLSLQCNEKPLDRHRLFLFLSVLFSVSHFRFSSSHSQYLLLSLSLSPFRCHPNTKHTFLDFQAIQHSFHLYSTFNSLFSLFFCFPYRTHRAALFCGAAI